LIFGEGETAPVTREVLRPDELDRNAVRRFTPADELRVIDDSKTREIESGLAKFQN